MSKYPPFVTAYGQIPKLFSAIKQASVPPKFTNDFMYTVLGLKSTSFRQMLPLLKRLGFLDQGNVPTQAYKNYREESRSREVLGVQIKSSYPEVYNASEYAHKLPKKDLQEKLKSVLGVEADDKNLAACVGTFLELAKLATFDGSVGDVSGDRHDQQGVGTGANGPSEKPAIPGAIKMGISYTINLNLPATTEVGVFNAIFKALRDNIIGNG